MWYIILAFICVGAGTSWLLFYAPHLKSPGTVNFVLVDSRIQQRLKKEEEKETPWWLSTIIVGVLLLCNYYQKVGAVVLILIGLAMAFFFFYRALKMWAILTRKKLKRASWKEAKTH